MSKITPKKYISFRCYFLSTKKLWQNLRKLNFEWPDILLFHIMYYKKREVITEMFGIDLKARLNNKAFWVAMASAIALLAQQLGLKIIPDNYTEIVNTVLTILTMLGIIVDTSTTGISDQTKTDSAENKTIE